MNSQNRMNFFQRTAAVLSATGTAALMALPVLAQAVPTEGVVNNGDVNRNSGMMNNQTPSNTSDNCGSYTNGAVGGPIGSQSTSQSANTTQTSPSSYNTARTGVPNTAGTVGQSNNQNMMGSSTYNNSSYNNSSYNNSSYNNSSYNNSGMQSAFPTRQFDGNNRSAAIAYRANGPAGTAGQEARLNLDAFQDRQNAYPAAYNSGSNQVAASLPVACAPR